MKLGLVVGLCLLPQLIVSGFFLFSVFIVAIDVGQMKDDSSSPQKGYTEGKVGFRIILFKNSYPTDAEKPKVTEVRWDIYYMTDFELTFSQLRKKFQDKLFDDLSFHFSFNPDLIIFHNAYEQLIRDSSLNINLKSLQFRTINTHVISYMTSNPSMATNKFAINCGTKCEIQSFKSTKEIPKDSLLGFEISNNFHHENKCKTPEHKLSFVMKSIKLDEASRGASGKWKNVNYKVESTLQEGEKVLDELTPFKMKTENRLAAVIFVLNSIPLAMLKVKNDSKSIDQYEFPYIVRFTGTVHAPNSNPDPFDDSNSGWPAMKQTYISGTNTFKSSFSSDNLYSKWQGGKEPISMTLDFKCLEDII